MCTKLKDGLHINRWHWRPRNAWAGTSGPCTCRRWWKQTNHPPFSFRWWSLALFHCRERRSLQLSAHRFGFQSDTSRSASLGRTLFHCDPSSPLYPRSGWACNSTLPSASPLSAPLPSKCWNLRHSRTLLSSRCSDLHSDSVKPQQWFSRFRLPWTFIWIAWSLPAFLFCSRLKLISRLSLQPTICLYRWWKKPNSQSYDRV